MGLCYIDLSSYDAAAGAFKKALALNSGYAPAIIGMAEALKYKGSNAEAIEWYKKYLDRYPDGEDALAARNSIEKLQ
jgi:tetratricopeptide (TPR) repeat protein